MHSPHRSPRRLDARVLPARIDPYQWLNLMWLAGFLAMVVLTGAIATRAGG